MMAEKILKSDNHDSKLDAERKDWMASESYFARSWTHVFFNWKHHRIMMGQTARHLIFAETKSMAGSRSGLWIGSHYLHRRRYLRRHPWGALVWA